MSRVPFIEQRHQPGDELGDCGSARPVSVELVIGVEQKIHI